MVVPQAGAVGKRITAAMYGDLVQAVIDLQTDVAAALPVITMVASGTPQTTFAGAITTLVGNVGGWVFSENAGGVDIAGQTGQQPVPIVIKEPGVYLIGIKIVNSVQASGRAFTDVRFSGGITKTLRCVWSLDDTANTTFVLQVKTATDVNVLLDSWMNVAGTVGSAEITCVKLHD